MRTFTVSFGEVIQENYKSIPQLPISIVDEQNNEVSKGYLTPFRRYCFQVSGDTHGNGDFGSSNVINLMSLYPLDEGLRKELLKGQITMAIETFIERGYVQFPCRKSSGNEEYKIVRPEYNPPIVDIGNEQYNYFNDFITKCDEWLFD